VTKVLAVAATWASNLQGLRRGDTTDPSADGPQKTLGRVSEESELPICFSGSGIFILDVEYQGSEGSQATSTPVKARLDSLLKLSSTDGSAGGAAVEFMHVSLLRLLVNVSAYNGDAIKAHLVSVVTSFTLATDGSSLSWLCMGWFWILDRLESSEKATKLLPRRQSLLCHSNLPRSGAEYVEGDRYGNIMEDLKDRGYAGSADMPAGGYVLECDL